MKHQMTSGRWLMAPLLTTLFYPSPSEAQKNPATRVFCTVDRFLPPETALRAELAEDSSIICEKIGNDKKIELVDSEREADLIIELVGKYDNFERLRFKVFAFRLLRDDIWETQQAGAISWGLARSNAARFLKLRMKGLDRTAKRAAEAPRDRF